MRKPLFDAILGVSIVVSAVAVGTATTRYLSLRSYSPVAPVATATPDEAGTSPFPVEEWKNPFSPSQGMKVPSRFQGSAGKATAPVSRTNFVLVGTIVSSTASARRAILWAEGMKEPRAYRETEEVEPGAVIASIERDKVWLARGSEREKLELLPVGSRSRPPAALPAAPAASGVQVTSPPATPPAAVALPSPEQAGDDEEGPRRRRRPAGSRTGR